MAVKANQAVAFDTMLTVRRQTIEMNPNVSVVALHSGIRSHPSAKVLTSIQNA